MKKSFLIFFIALYAAANAQHMSFRVVTLDGETHDTVKGVNMIFAYYTYNAKTKISANDTLRDSSDSKGFARFSKQVQPPFLAGHLIVQTSDPHYRSDKYPLRLADTARTIVYYLYAPGYTDYFQDFYFPPNSSVVSDTNLFYQWELNMLHGTTPLIAIKAYYAPGENPKLAQQRAEAVLQGFVKRGASARAFVIQPVAINEFTLNHGEYALGDSKDSFFAKGTLINKKFIATLKGKRKEAAMQMMRTVRLSRY